MGIKSLLKNIPIIGGLLFITSCQVEESYVPMPETISHLTLSKRTPEDAIKIGKEAYCAHFGPISSRSADDSQISVHAVTMSIAHSRSIEKNDTCLFIVNFGENKGYAIVAADSRVSPIFGVTDKGHYDPTSDSRNPGVEYYIGRTIDYLNSEDVPKSPLGDIVISQPKVEVKEWEDSSFLINIPQRVKHAWSPGIINEPFSDSTHPTLSTLQNNPTGYYFSKNYCGEAVVALAHTMLYFYYPSRIPATRHPKDYSAMETEAFEPSWGQIKLHGRYSLHSYSVYQCTDLEIKRCHEQVAILCRALGNLTSCESYGTQSKPIITTSILDIYDAVKKLGFHIQPWESFSDNVILSNSPAVLLVNGVLPEDIAEFSHYWLIDGEKKFIARHHFATREAGQPWKETITATYSKDLFHINWSQKGDGDGWYDRGPFSPRTKPSSIYLDPTYTEISLPEHLLNTSR